MIGTTDAGCNLGSLLEIALGAALALLLLPVAVLTAEVFLALTWRHEPVAVDGDRPSLAVVMPAHRWKRAGERTLTMAADITR